MAFLKGLGFVKIKFNVLLIILLICVSALLIIFISASGNVHDQTKNI
jgi:hypothetical protein